MLNTAPKPPDYFVIRQQEGEQLLKLLLQGDEATPRAVALTTALQGGGGFGKTTLAQWLCDQPQVQDRFRNGIIWLTVGQEPNLAALHVACLKKLTDHHQVDRADLPRQQILIVLDDVWQTDVVRHFKKNNQTSDYSYLITTRDKDIPLSADVQASAVDVSRMTQRESVALLLAGFPQPDDMAGVFDMVAFLGEWPLLLKLANAQLRRRIERKNVSLAQAMAYITKRLQKRGFSDLKVDTEADRNQAIGLSLDLSLEQLGQRKKRYLELAIFPEDTAIPVETLDKLWQQTAALDEFDCDDALLAIERFSLFDRHDPDQKTVRLHDVVRHYLLEQYRDNPANLTNLHQQFLNAYRADLTGFQNLSGLSYWADLPHEEPYLWDNLAHHLIAAKQPDQLLRTVKDLRYLASKSYVTTTPAVENDLRLAQTHFPDDEQLAQLHRTFVHATHLLQPCEKLLDLQAILYSRLCYITELEPLCQRFRSTLTGVVIIPRHLLPDQPEPTLIRTFSDHINGIVACAFSSDGKQVLSASDDGGLNLWEVKSGELIRTFRGHAGRVNTCVFSPDGKHILSASEDTTFRLWEVKSGELIRTFRGHAGGVNACAFSPDGQTILSASGDKSLKLWRAVSGECIRTFNGHIDEVRVCAFSPDGKHILSASEDTTLRLWEVKSGAFIRSFGGNTGWVRGCALSPDGKQILFAYLDTTLRLWEVKNGALIRTFRGHTDWVRACTFSPDGKYILSASEDMTLKLWEVESGVLIHTFRGHTGWIWDCAFSPDGKHILSASEDMTLKLWEVESGVLSRIVSDYTDEVTACVFSPDGKHILSVSLDNTLKLWEVESGTLSRTFGGHTDFVTACAFNPDGRQVLSASNDGTLNLWELESGVFSSIFHDHTDEVTACAFSPDRTTILSASYDGTLKLWKLESGTLSRTFNGHTGGIRACAFSPDGTQVLSASSDETLNLWEVESGVLSRTFRGHIDSVTACAFSPDGQIILSASWDNTLKLWRAASGECIRTLSGHTKWVTACAFSPDGQTILSASSDKTLKLWEVATGRCLTTLPVDGLLHDCAWSPNGRDIVAVGRGGIYFLQVVGLEGVNNE